MRIMETLLGAPVAWQSPDELARAVGGDFEGTIDLLAELDADGWLSAWDREPGPVVTLSVEAASRLGFRLIELGRDEVPRWARMGDPEPPRPRASRVFRDERAAGLGSVVDPSCGPEEAAERAEEALARVSGPPGSQGRGVERNLPAPTQLVGLGLTPWPGPGQGSRPDQPCPSCGSGWLEPSMYCLYCDRWGLDHRLFDGPPARPATPRPTRQGIGIGIGDGGDDRRDRERDQRKSRRKARRLAQAKVGRNPRRTIGARL